MRVHAQHRSNLPMFPLASWILPNPLISLMPPLIWSMRVFSWRYCIVMHGFLFSRNAPAFYAPAAFFVSRNLLILGLLVALLMKHLTTGSSNFIGSMAIAFQSMAKVSALRIRFHIFCAPQAT